MKRRNRPFLLTPHLTALALLFTVPGCGPKVHEFTVVPVRVCGEQDFVTDWRVRGDADLTMRLEPADPMDADEPDLLSMLLTVRKGGRQVQAERDVLRFPDQFSHPIVIRTGERDSAHNVVAIDSINAATWPDAFELTTVASASNLSLDVTHGGVTEALDAAGTPSRAFAGMPLSGPWELHATLDPNGPTPDRLRVIAGVTCTS